ncbi:unnamed protein product [Mucor hiemalis]
MSNTNSNNNNSDIPLLTSPFFHYIPTSPPSQELDFHLPSRTPLHGLTVSEWAGSKTRHLHHLNNTASSIHSNTNTTIAATADTTTTTASIVTAAPTTTTTTTATTTTKPIVLKDASEDNWKDVYRNIKCMDQLYDASFYSWLKSEDNVLVTAMYLHRIANEYPLVRIINALKWLISDWRLESISTLVRHVTVDWCDEAGDLRRAHLLRHLTTSWATQYTTTLITTVLSSAPYANSTSFQRERFLRAFTKDWDFSKLSEFFMYLQSPANIDYKVKCVMLQEAARRERETLSAKLRKKRVVALDAHQVVTPISTTPSDSNIATDSSVVEDTVMENTTASSNATATTSSSNTGRRHHRRTSSNDVNDIKRLRLSTPDLGHTESSTQSQQEQQQQQQLQQPQLQPIQQPHNGTSSTRRSASPEHYNHHHHHHLNHHPLRCVTTNTAGNMSSELSHLHLTTGSSSSHSNGGSHSNNNSSSSSSSSNAIVHGRGRSSSIMSTDSLNDDPMDTTADSTLNARKRGGPSSISTHFTSTTAATADE